MTQSSIEDSISQSSFPLQPIQTVFEGGSTQVIKVENSLHQAISRAILELKSQIQSTDYRNKISDSILILEAFEISTRGKRPDEITYEMKLKILEDIFKDEEISKPSRKTEKTIHGFDRIFSTQHGITRVFERDPSLKQYVVENCDKLLFPLLAFFSPSSLKYILFLSNLERAQTVLHELNHIIAEDPKFTELKNLFPSNIGSFIARVANQNTNPQILLQEILDNINKLKIIKSTFGFDSDQISSIFSASRTSFSRKVDDIIRHKDIIIKWIKESGLNAIVALLSNKNNLNDAIPIFDKLNIHLIIKDQLINIKDLKSFNSIRTRIKFLKLQNSIEDYRIKDEDLDKLSKFSKSDSKKTDSQDPHPDSLIRERRSKKRKATVLLESDIGADIDSSRDPRIGSSDGLSFSTFEEIPSQITNSSKRVTHEEASASISQLSESFKDHVRENYQHQPFLLDYQMQPTAESSISTSLEMDSELFKNSSFALSDQAEFSQQPSFASSTASYPIRPTALPSFALAPISDPKNYPSIIRKVNANQAREDAVIPLTSSPATSGNLSISVSNVSSALAGVSAFNSSANRSAFNRRT